MSTHRSYTTLVQLLRSTADRQPLKRAYTFLPDGEAEGRSLNYFELDREARAIAASLQSAKAKGERALLLYQQGLEFVAAFYGCLYAGVIAVPTPPILNQKRANQTLSRVQVIANDARPMAVLTTSSILSKAMPLSENVPALKAARWLATDQLSDGIAQTWREPDVRADDLALLQYTSGSTASPKGVMVSHANLLYNSAYINEGFGHTPESVSLTWLPHFHDMGLIDGIIQPLYMGFPCYLMPAASFLQNPFRWLDAISRYRVTHSGGPNFAYDLCVRKVNAEKRDSLDLSSWSVAYDGAEPVRHHTLEEFAATFAPSGFRRSAFYPAYGLAESTLKVTGGRRGGGPVFCSVDAGALEKGKIIEAIDKESEARTLVGSGRMSFGTSVVIVNPETLARCAPDQVGEIWTAGPGVAQGYWNRPKETEEVFQAYLADTHEGPFLRTGDLGFIKDGELYVTGRLKDLIIIRGLNHYPQDIELTAERSHPALRLGGGAAFSVDAGGEERLVVIHEIDPRQPADLNTVIDSIRQAVAEHHDVQVYAITLVEFGSVPKTSSGKTQRRACRAMFLEGGLNALAQWRSPSTSESDLSSAAAGRPEQNLGAVAEWLRAQLAAKVGVAPSKIDINQPITRYGLDSLIAIELTHSIQASLGVSLSMTSFLESSSISELAAHVMQQLEAKPAPQDAVLSVSHDEQEVEEAPLSFGQQSLWFLHQIAPESAAYNIAFPVLVKTELDVAALRRAFQLLVDRHASLRTTFRVSHGGPSQQVRKHMEVSFEAEDASLWDNESLNARLLAEAYRPFNLEAGPLFRVRVFSLSPGEHVLLVAVHHIVTDLWSLAVLLPELGAIYSAERHGEAASLPPCTLRYTDYVRWESQMVSSREGERLLSYWRRQLEGASPITNLPTDRPRPMLQTYSGAAEKFHFDAEQTRRLKELSIDSGATLFMTLLAAFQTLIHRYTGQDETLVGSPTAGRDRADMAGLIGYLVNPVVLRADFSEAQTFRSLLGQVRQTVIEALAHSRYPFPLLVKQLQLERDPGRSPLFQVFFVLQKSQSINEAGITSLALGEAGVRIKIGELELESMALEQRIAQFDLSLVMTEIDGRLRGSLEYNTDLFDRPTIERMAGHFQTLVKEIIADPDRRESRLQILTEAERETILVDWNETAADYGEFQSLQELFELQVERTPGAVAVVYEDSTLTYCELNERANQLAHMLRSEEVGPDVCVGVLMERSIELVAGLLGILKAGGAYVPLDPQYPQERLAFMAEDAGLNIVLTQKRFADNITARNIKTFCLDDCDSLASESAHNPTCETSRDNLAYVIYTSGSTGKPKGAMNTHRGIINRLCWMQSEYGLVDADRVLQKTPFTFDVSVWEFFWPLIAGARLVLTRPGGHQDAAYLVKLISDQQITTLHFVPSMLQVFLEEPRLAECRSIKRVICSGEALSAELQDSFFARFAADLHNLYGPTEAAVDVTCWACERDSNRQRVPIGRPIANTQIYILDKEMQPVPAGVTGGLYIAGVGLARGYLNRPDMTAAKFIPNPFAIRMGERMYETGDLARFLPGGEIEFLGRADHQVKIRGFRIELGEIEAALAAHPAVREVVVVASETRARDKAIVAYLSPTQEHLPTMSRLSEESEPEAATPFSPEEYRSLAERRRYKLSNGMMIAHDGDIQFNTMDIYREIFEREVYLKHGVTLSDGDVVFDVGAHIGLFTLFVNTKCKGARVYAFEPIPTTFEILRSNVALPGLNVKLFNFGLASESKSALFNYYPRMTGVSGYVTDAEEHKRRRKPILLNWFQRVASEQQRTMLSERDVNEILDEYFKGKVYECRLKTLSDVIRENRVGRIDLLKIDVEKSELDVLSGIRDEDWKKIKQIVVEVESKEILERLTPMLTGHGFSFVAEKQSDGSAPDQNHDGGPDDDWAGVYMVYAVQESMESSLITGEPEAVSSAVLAAPEGSVLSGSNLRKYLQARLPDYMIPSAFVLLERLPLTPNGKIDRRALPRPEYTRNRPGHEYVGPRTEQEEALADIFSEVLGVERVGIHDSFFDLGGHSLLAAQVLTRVAERFKVEVPLRRLFEAPTVAALADAVSKGNGLEARATNPIIRISQSADELLAKLDEMSDSQIEALLMDFTREERRK